MNLFIVVCVSGDDISRARFRITGVSCVCVCDEINNIPLSIFLDNVALGAEEESF